MRVATGESVAFEYELAGLGSRFVAVVADLAIQILATILVALLLFWIGSAIPRLGAFATSLGQNVIYALLIAATFVIFFGYFIIIEWRWNGSTPGKRLVGIRVVRDGGFPIDFTASIVRNVVRMLEFGFGFYLLSAVSTLLSPSNRRLGDFAAGTIVVRDGGYVRAPRLPETGDEDPAFARVSVEERELAYRYVDRKRSFGTKARRALAARLAAPLRPKLGERVTAYDDDMLLEYVAHLGRGASAPGPGPS